MAKVIHCYPAKTVSISICCKTCERYDPNGTIDGARTEVCTFGGENTPIEDAKKWRCTEWKLDPNIDLNT